MESLNRNSFMMIARIVASLFSFSSTSTQKQGVDRGNFNREGRIGGEAKVIRVKADKNVNTYKRGGIVIKRYCVFLLILLTTCCMWASEDTKTIRISTDNTDLILQVSPQGRLYQVYLGERLEHELDIKLFNWCSYAGSDDSVSVRGHEAYAASGGEDFFEPAIAVTHADGNQTTYLYYESHSQKPVDGGIETIIRLADKLYPIDVTLHYIAYTKENVIKAWSEVSHRENLPVHLWRYCSAMLYFQADKYFLTNYYSDWAREGQPAHQQLQYGKKIIDTKLGTRAAMQCEPFFELAFDKPADEQSGKVMLGCIGWTGNFSCTFEIDNTGVLRLLPGINPYASYYELNANDTFRTPEFIFTMSYDGIGNASRSLHDWARLYQVSDGKGDRMTLLNNWENTGFDFNQSTLVQLMKDAKDLGVDMFLLDDGWFANKYPRKNDRSGLGDWEVTADKLPKGLSFLTEAARKTGVKFGLWVEPEMVNPKSRLFEQHPEWAITLPNRDTYYYRNQLVLDLSNPQVQDFVYDVIDRLMTENPEIAYFKWDCNSPITNIFSHHLADKQGNLYIDYVRGLYNVLTRIHQKYPDLPMMLCSGGGARCDYEALKYFTEFWCSDNTDPYERIYMQWTMSKFFPAKTMASHVTNWNKNTDLKFRIDVASMCRLGFDIDLSGMSRADRLFAKQALSNYHLLKPIILDGDQYRLISPYESNHAALCYVSKDKSRAVVFAYDLHPRYREPLQRVRLQGLDPSRRYVVYETNLRQTAKNDYGADADSSPSQGCRPSKAECHGKIFTGDYLMKVGINILSAEEGKSHVFTLEEQK